ncbi:MAG: hypothetical protein HUU35_08905 [Armatimonadetes bacterium]|nr:hypothetical protein [Armatimonadota bacterium]
MERITVRAERLFESERVFYGKVGDRPGELLAMELGLTSMLVGKPPPVPGWLYLQVEGLRFVLDSALRDRVVTAAVDQGLCD